MFQITLKHLFFLILALNLFVTVFFWNVSRYPQQFHDSSISAVKTPNPSVASAKPAAPNAEAPTKDKTVGGALGQHLKTTGGPTYINDPDNQNYGDMQRATEEIKAEKALRAIGIVLSKPSYKKLEVSQMVVKAVEIFKKNASKYEEENKVLVETTEQLKGLGLVDKLREDISLVNPFRQYDLYTYMNNTLFNGYPGSRPMYYRDYFGVKTDQNYCDLVDLYNLYHPENIYDHMNFVMDYVPGSLVRKYVAPQNGLDVMPYIGFQMSDRKNGRYPMAINATTFFFKRVNVHQYWEISKTFMCMTQTYGHIPGHGVLTRKDFVAKSANEYAKRYENKPQCFNKRMIVPESFRLRVKSECEEFFTILHSQEYKDAKVHDPLQFILKKGHSSHRAMGVYLFTQEEEDDLVQTMKDGERCGILKTSLVAQRYISNPLLLDKQNKFDFRIYMLIASVDPLIVYYHDGFLRLSLTKYDKFSKEKNVHLTNTHLSKEVFAIAREQREYQGMNETELRDYQMWTMQELSDYLNEIGKVNDTNWLDNYLKPKFQEAFIHLVRLSEYSFLKHPGAYEMFGLDFLLDDNLNLWFIECNASPQLIGTSKEKLDFLITLVADMFDIQYAYLRSRFKRIQQYIGNLQAQSAGRNKLDKETIKREFTAINRNKLEPEFPIRANNTFQVIMDKNLQGPAAYFGHMTPECIDD
jgi:tubulin polyglutamylase TTLL1